MKGLITRTGLVAAIALAAMLPPALSACGTSATSHARAARPVVIDTDMSSDDIMALAYLLQKPGISVRAITVEGTGVADGLSGAQNASRLVRALGIPRRIPIAYGPAKPLAGAAAFPPAWRKTADRMYGLHIPAWSGPEPAPDAVSLLTRTLRSVRSRQVSVITLGPLTNVALALRAQPAIAAKIARIYAMAGAIHVPGNEPVHQRAEWNVYIDPKAANIVLRSAAPVTVVPLDASNNVPITTFIASAVQANRSTAAMRLLAEMLNDPFYTQAPVYFWDPLTAVAATDKHVLRESPARLTVAQGPGAGSGETTIGQAGARVMLATSANAGAFARDFLTTLNGGRPVLVPEVPATQRLTVGFDGARYTSRVPSSLAAGEMAVRLSNGAPARSGGFHLIVGRLRAGKTLADVSDVIKRGRVTSVPSWFQTMSVLPAPPRADAVWGIALVPGDYVLVCSRDADGALRALTEVRILRRS
ncbi:MAG TPA: nucleoside hydrolase [Streptosporangiaceae bacterium]